MQGLRAAPVGLKTDWCSWSGMKVWAGSLILVTNSHPNLYAICRAPIQPQNQEGKERKICFIRDSCGPDKHVMDKINPTLLQFL